MKVKIETDNKSFEYVPYEVDNCTNEMMLSIHRRHLDEYSDKIVTFAKTTFHSPGHEVVITTTIEEVKERTLTLAKTKDFDEDMIRKSLERDMNRRLETKSRNYIVRKGY